MSKKVNEKVANEKVSKIYKEKKPIDWGGGSFPDPKKRKKEATNKELDWGGGSFPDPRK